MSGPLTYSIAANVLLTAAGRILLCDFGVSARLIHTHSKRTTFVGTPYWMAPEVIQQSQYDTKADIWSLGITLYEMVTGAPPHAKEDQMRALLIIPKVKAPRLPETTGSKDMRDFVASVLREQPADVSDARCLTSLSESQTETYRRRPSAIKMDKGGCKDIIVSAERVNWPVPDLVRPRWHAT